MRLVKFKETFKEFGEAARVRKWVIDVDKIFSMKEEDPSEYNPKRHVRIRSSSLETDEGIDVDGTLDQLIELINKENQ